MSMCFEKCATNQQINSITKIKDLYNPYYVYYWLSTKKDYLFSIASVTRTPILSKGAFEDVLIPIPEKKIQDSVAEFLLAIDKKIQLNNRIIAELETMAQTIYDYWFVQFDFPNENGRPYCSSGGEMAWNEQLKREIPKGWNVNAIEPLINIVRGVTYGKNDVSDVPQTDYVQLLRANNIFNGTINYNSVVYVDRNKISETQYLTQDSIFICMSSGSMNHVGKTAIVTTQIGSAYGAFCSKIEILPHAFCWLGVYFRSDHFNGYIRNMCLGTSINNLNNEMLYNILLPIPPDDVLSSFQKAVTPIIQKHGALDKENLELAKLRDWLLPMLINGQITVE